MQIVGGNVNEVATEFLARAVQQPAVVGYTGDDGIQRVVMVQVVRLSGGLFLLVGRDMSERQRFADITRQRVTEPVRELKDQGIVEAHLLA